jgi:hypothetical protein
MPGFVTASINNADHFGTSGNGLLCLRMCRAPFISLFVVFGLKQRFPLVGTLGHEWVPERTPEGAKRSAAVEAKRRLVRAGSRGTIGPERGELNKRSLVSSRSGCEYTKEDANDYRSGCESG